MTALYSLNRGDHFKFTKGNLRTPPDAPEVDPNAVWQYLKTDGMYAQIHNGGPIAYVACYTEVIKVEV